MRAILLVFTFIITGVVAGMIGFAEGRRPIQLPGEEIQLFVTDKENKLIASEKIRFQEGQEEYKSEDRSGMDIDAKRFSGTDRRADWRCSLDYPQQENRLG